MHSRVLLKNFPVGTCDWSAEFWAADVMFWRVRWVKWVIVEPYFRLESLFGEFWHHNVLTTLMISILDSVLQSGDLPEDLKPCSANTDWEFSRKKWSPDVDFEIMLSRGLWRLRMANLVKSMCQDLVSEVKASKRILMPIYHARGIERRSAFLATMLLFRNYRRKS